MVTIFTLLYLSNGGPAPAAGLPSFVYDSVSEVPGPADRWLWYGGVLLRGVRSLSKKVWELEPARA